MKSSKPTETETSMLRIHKSRKTGKGLTEYEEDIHFDDDDPDFDSNYLPSHQPHLNVISSLSGPIFLTVPTKMSMASLQPPELHTKSKTSSSTLNHGLDDTSSWTSVEVISIEQLRRQLSTCYTCGVLWREFQVSLDCYECDGYAMERPCPACDGRCGAIWKRDLSTSHSTGKARWLGACLGEDTESDLTDFSDGGLRKNGPIVDEQFGAELRTRLEQLLAKVQNGDI